MSHPFIIWTMQRTGGTALTDLLMGISEHKAAEHEPFNWARVKPRQFFPIADAWNKTHDLDGLHRSFEAIVQDRYLIKHCYELHPAEFNKHLMEVAAAASYRQVLLLRRDEYARLVSKFIAETNGTWFKDYADRVFGEVAERKRRLSPLPIDKMTGHYRHCLVATASVCDGLAKIGAQAREIYFEDLYVGETSPRLEKARDLLDFLGFSAGEMERNAGLIEQTLFHSGQDTGAVAEFVPNITAVRAALAAEGCPPFSPGESDQHVRSGGDFRTADRDSPTGPRAKLRAEIQSLAQTYAARGPVLEIAADVRDLAISSIGHFNGEQRHVIGLGEEARLEGVTAHAVDPHDMRDLFADGSVGTVISNNALAHDPRFWETVDEIRRVLAPGGLAIFITPCFSKVPNDAGVIAVGRKGNPVTALTLTHRVHASPDYWRISPQAMKQVILEGFDVQEVRVKMMTPYVFGVGIKAE